MHGHPLKKEYFWVLESSQKHRAVSFVHCVPDELSVQRENEEQKFKWNMLIWTEFPLSYMGLQNSLLEAGG